MHFVWKEYSLKDTKVWVEKILCDLTFCTTLTISNVSFRAYKNLDVTCLPMRSWSTLHRNKSATQSVLLPRRPMIWRELLLIVFDALIHCCFLCIQNADGLPPLLSRQSWFGTKCLIHVIVNYHQIPSSRVKITPEIIKIIDQFM